MYNVSCETFNSFVCNIMFHVKLELNKNQFKNVSRETAIKTKKQFKMFHVKQFLILWN